MAVAEAVRSPHEQALAVAGAVECAQRRLSSRQPFPAGMVGEGAVALC